MISLRPSGHGGGGAGGAIIAIAPSMNTTGAANVTHGTSGGLASAGTVTDNPRFSGGGSCGQGEQGGFVEPIGSTTSGGNSPTEGCVYTVTSDPVNLLF